MTQPTRSTLATAVAITGLCLGAAGASADSGVTDGVSGDAPVPIVIFDREVNTMLLPQLREQDAKSSSRRPPKPTTLLQLDAPVGEDSDVLFRVQAKQKQFLFLEFRF